MKSSFSKHFKKLLLLFANHQNQKFILEKNLSIFKVRLHSQMVKKMLINYVYMFICKNS